jgi:hypothetical protein
MHQGAGTSQHKYIKALGQGSSFLQRLILPTKLNTLHMPLARAAAARSHAQTHTPNAQNSATIALQLHLRQLLPGLTSRTVA